jgi:peptide/nickel transport system permease protein
MAGLATFDFGTSMWTGRPVAEEIGIRIGVTFQVALMVAAISVVIAIPLGTLSALFRDTWIDYVVRILSIAGLAVPSFWLGMVIILTLLYFFRWSPPVTYTSFWVDPVANLSQLIWPALAIGYRFSSMVTRMVRSSVIEVLQEDYIRTARAKGVYERLVISRHVMRNALLPAVTVIGLEFAFLIGGLVVTEQVFNLNGIGRLLIDSITRSDFIMVQALVMLIAAFIAIVNLVVDLTYGVLDPRIRYK